MARAMVLLRKKASARERRDAQLAQNILPFRNRGNLLLCTLLFGNVAVNCMLSILMADMTSGFTGFLISTLTIVIFGEIVPQSVCSRHPLAIGSACIPLVYLFVVLTFVVSYPTSLVLDYMLGEDMGTIYSRNQLKGMLEMYANMKETDFGTEETNMMAGVVDFSNKIVGQCMTHLKEVQRRSLVAWLQCSAHSAAVPLLLAAQTRTQSKVLDSCILLRCVCFLL